MPAKLLTTATTCSRFIYGSTDTLVPKIPFIHTATVLNTGIPNQLRPSDEDGQEEILKRIFQKEFKNIKIWAPFQCFHGKNITLGKNFFANHNFIVIDMCEVIIGDDVMIGPNVTITTASHPKSPRQRKENIEFGAKVVIEDGVWIASGVTICPGVTIGQNSIIGAGSVVTKNIPANVVAYGTPCKVTEKIKEK